MVKKKSKEFPDVQIQLCIYIFSILPARKSRIFVQIKKRQLKKNNLLQSCLLRFSLVPPYSNGTYISQLTPSSSSTSSAMASSSSMAKNVMRDNVPLSRFGVLAAQLESIAASAAQQPPDPLLCFDLLSDLISAIDDGTKVILSSLLTTLPQISFSVHFHYYALLFSITHCIVIQLNRYYIRFSKL